MDPRNRLRRLFYECERLADSEAALAAAGLDSPDSVLALLTEIGEKHYAADMIEGQQLALADMAHKEAAEARRQRSYHSTRQAARSCT